jgi:glutamate N-acetyltransferase/amino-acid N-acetyltransferase
VKLPEGFLISSTHCGIKKKKLDLGLIVCPAFAKVVAFFTANVNPSYSVTLSKKNIDNPIRAVLVNSGNANCFSHKNGLKDTGEIVSEVARHFKVSKKNILVASTGIIGKRLPKEKIIKSLPILIKELCDGKEAKKDTIKNFSRSILTTDKVEKISYASLPIGKRNVEIIGFAKGAGMISPHLATMLGFILTDAAVHLSIFKRVSKEAVEKSFNSITVDGCMSTNDTVFFLSSGRVPLKNKREIDLFSKKLKALCLDLAKMIVKDAEGATKFAEIYVKGAKTKSEAKRAALSVANSNLFKTAIYGGNSNWGRVIAALGAAKIKADSVSVKATSLKKRELKIIIDLKSGKFEWKVYTSDLTPEYIKINAKYN